MIREPLHTSDDDRARAAEVRLLIVRLEASAAADPDLGYDIVDACCAPRTIGDPAIAVDAALILAERLGQRAGDVIGAVLRSKRAPMSREEIARAMCLVILRIHLAKLERAPA